MARFSFAKGRKKSPPQLVLAEPMSKAHKILGSTPINIDSPKPWDDTSSGFSGGTSNDTVPSYASSDDDAFDHHVAIAPSEDEWANGLEMRPAVLQSSGLDYESDHGMSDATHTLRKTQSSSTIRSWYDTSKPPLPISQQTSTPSMVRGMPSKIHKMLDLENSPTSSKSKKKPPMLDFSNLRTGSRSSRKASQGQLRTDGTVTNDIERPAIGSPSLSLFTPTGKPRKIQKRNTKDGVMSPTVEETQGSKMAGQRRRGSSMKEAPSLYDHYEQMTLRQIMHEAETLEGEQQGGEETTEDEANMEDHEELWPVKDWPWLHDILPPTPQAAFMTGLKPAASHNRSNSATSKTTTNTKRSKTLDRSDLQETSMLMLSSDSEDDDEPSPLQQSQTTSPSRHFSGSASRAPSSRASSRTSDNRPIRHSKKTSFALVDTYITLPSSSRLSTDTAIPIEGDSRSSTPYTCTSSSRTSLMSNANYIQEARAVTMLAGRRPAQVDNGEDNLLAGTFPAGASYMNSLTPAARRALSIAQTPPEELTPPLSPTSVDFFIRSTRSSIDGSGSQNRYIAATRQEEMLLSSLRSEKKHDGEQLYELLQQPARGYSVGALTQASTTAEKVDAETDGVLGLDLMEGEAMFHFGFPAPPGARRRSCFEKALDTSARVGSRTSTATSDKPLQSGIAESESMPELRQTSLTPSPTAQMPLRGILKTSGVQSEKPDQEEVILYLDEAEPTPDTPDFAEFGYLVMPSLQSQQIDNPVNSGSEVSDTMPTQASWSPPRSTSDTKHADRARHSPSAMTAVPEESELDYGYGGIPRPDSPISPDAFPTVPQVRTTLSSMARLSAVGSASMMNKPGW